MIARIWHGYTTSGNGKAYEQLLQSRILPSIEARHGHKVQLLVRDLTDDDEIEFITICYFDDLEQIKKFAGDDYERCVVPDEARVLLKRFDQRSRHYELKRTGPQV
jgi:hypothetical protein